MTRAERRAHWRTIIENQTTSGVSVAAYCRNVQIKPSYFILGGAGSESSNLAPEASLN